MAHNFFDLALINMLVKFIHVVRVKVVHSFFIVIFLFFFFFFFFFFGSHPRHMEVPG